MAKYYGAVGYLTTVKTKPGVWSEEIIEKNYPGEFTRNSSKFVTGSGLNDDITTNNEISILADAFAFENLHSIKYVTYMGTKWKVTAVEVKQPRLILSIGGVYSGE